MTRYPLLTRRLFSAAALASAAASAQAQTGSDPLPSWKEGAAKDGILKFVRDTTDQSNPNFVPPAERIAEFDQDGTLWVEHPVYTQVVFCLERVPALVKAKPELGQREPFKTVLSGNRDAIAHLSMGEIFEIVLATQSGMTVDVFREQVGKWLAMATHPRWNRRYTDLVYQPMLEVLRLFRANGYRTFIATGGSAGFVREYSDEVYGILPEQVCGTEQAFKYGYDKDHRPILTQEPKLALDNLGAGKLENFWPAADCDYRPWCCTTMRNESTRTARRKGCPTLRWAHSARRCTTSRRSRAG